MTDNNVALNHLLEVESSLNERMNAVLIEPKSFIFWQGINLISEGTITTIQGKSGTHKSRLAQEFATILLGQVNSTFSGLGMKKINEEPIMVAYLDTERNSSYELPNALKNIAMSAAINTPNPLFRCTSLRDLSRKTRRQASEDFIDHIRHEYEGNLCVIVDVATDISQDFNSVAETFEVLDQLKVWMNKYQCAVIVVIHENPGSGKMRGHLGTEFLNKTSDAIGIKLDSDDSIIIKFEKCRSHKKPKSFNAFYNEANGRLEISKEYNPKNAKIQFTEKLTESFTAADVLTRQQIIDSMSIIDRGVDTLDNWLAETKLITIAGVNYSIVRGREGKETTFEKKIIENQSPEVMAG